MINSYERELESRFSEKLKTSTNKEQPITESRISFASLGRKPKELLSAEVWSRSHPTTASEKVVTQPLPKIDKNQTVSGRESSYELELLNRRLNLLSDKFLDTPDSYWSQVEVIFPASFSTSESYTSEDSPSISDQPVGRKQFISLRGLPGLNQTSSCSNYTKVKGEDDIEETQSLVNSGQFFLTGRDYCEENYLETDCELSSKKTMLTPRDVDTPVVIPSPREEKQDDDAISRDVSTSPYQDITGAPPTTPDIKVFRIDTSRVKRTPHYPFETGKYTKHTRTLNRPTMHNGMMRSNRLYDYSHPSVVSSTQQLLCLTPSKGGIISLSHDEIPPKNQENTKLQRFNENDGSTPVPLAATIVRKNTGVNGGQSNNNFFRLMNRDGSPRPRTSTAHGHPFSLANLHYKHTTQIRKPYRYPALSPSVRKTDVIASKTSNTDRNATAMSVTKQPANTAYRIIEKHVKNNRRLPIFYQDGTANVYPYQPCFTIHNSGTQARKMAPVLRVIPAFPQATKSQHQLYRKKVAKSPVDTEPASQKKVRFSDQMGLPLVRNATPNYRRKHSYILRWLETAGRPANSIPLV